MPRTIAPNLGLLVSGKRLRWPHQTRLQARSELQRMAAVVRAARRVSADTAGDEDAVVHLCALDRALERLDRLTNPPRVARKAKR